MRAIITKLIFKGKSMQLVFFGINSTGIEYLMKLNAVF